MLDLLITGGQLVDGTGAPARTADIGVCGDRITAVGDLSAAEAKRTLPAEGCLVCPGFVDVHSHSDAYLLIEPSAPSKVFQGVTTEVVGNCGASAAPLTGKWNLPTDWLDKTYPGAWRTVADYRRLLEAAKPAVNVAMLIGHNTLRAGVAGYQNRSLDATEHRDMIRLLEQALDEGAVGLSSGLIYPPGLFAPPGEVNDLARCVARRGGVYASHMRSEGGRLLEAIGETLAVGRETGVRVEISHLKTSGRANWSLLDRALAQIETARNNGIAAAADRYPYTASNTDLDAVFPAWAQEGGRDAVLARLRDPDTRRKLRDELAASRTETYWEGVTVGSTAHSDNRRFQGRPLLEAARTLGLDPAETVLHFAQTDQLRTSAFFFGMSEANLDVILRRPWVMIGSDASIRAPHGPLSVDYPHPRAYGAFARFLRMALDGKTVLLEEAVRKITSLPAWHFGLTQRGILARGYYADIVVADPVALAERATYSDPHRLAEGIRAVMVNGTPVLEQGRLTGQRSGRFLGKEQG
jgi:N-acyl-D-amino-acid deacylase